MALDRPALGRVRPRGLPAPNAPQFYRTRARRLASLGLSARIGIWGGGLVEQETLMRLKLVTCIFAFAAFCLVAVAGSGPASAGGSGYRVHKVHGYHGRGYKRHYHRHRHVRRRAPRVRGYRRRDWRYRRPYRGNYRYVAPEMGLGYPGYYRYP